MPNANKAPSAEVVAAMVDSIRIFYQDHKDSFGPDDRRVVESLPAKAYILNEMDEPQLDVLYRSIRHMWVGISGEEPDFSESSQDARHLDGAYWFLPGGVLVAGYNHFTAAKDHKSMVCALLDINPIVFEQLLARQNPDDVIYLMIARGGVRTMIDRGKSEVVMQTGEPSWPWVKEKLEKMYHQNKIAKVVDLSKPYEGWTSGVTIRIH